MTPPQLDTTISDPSTTVWRCRSQPSGSQQLTSFLCSRASWGVQAPWKLPLECAACGKLAPTHGWQMAPSKQHSCTVSNSYPKWITASANGSRCLRNENTRAQRKRKGSSGRDRTALSSLLHTPGKSTKCWLSLDWEDSHDQSLMLPTPQRTFCTPAPKSSLCIPQVHLQCHPTHSVGTNQAACSHWGEGSPNDIWGNFCILLPVK